MSEGATLAAGAVVPPRMTVPAGTPSIDTPAKVKRELTPDEIAANRAMAEKYARRAAGLLES